MAYPEPVVLSSDRCRWRESLARSLNALAPFRKRHLLWKGVSFHLEVVFCVYVEVTKLELLALLKIQACPRRKCFYLFIHPFIHLFIYLFIWYTWLRFVPHLNRILCVRLLSFIQSPRRDLVRGFSASFEGPNWAARGQHFPSESLAGAWPPRATRGSALPFFFFFLFFFLPLLQTSKSPKLFARQNRNRMQQKG